MRVTGGAGPDPGPARAGAGWRRVADPGLLRRAVGRYLDDGMTDRAPAIAYYGILSLFPLLLIAFALIRLVAGADAPDDLARRVTEAGASGAIADALRSAAETARAAAAPTAGVAGAIGLVALVYGGSRAFTAAGRAMDAVAHRPSTRRSIGRRLEDVGWSLAMLVAVLALLVFALVSGRVLRELLELVGLGEQLAVWQVVRWPAVAAVGLLVVALVRWAAPTGPRPPLRILTPGTLVSVAGVLVGTVAYNVYLSTLATYNTTYGAFAAGVILLLWIWLAASSLLFGAELDAALDQRR